MARPLKSAFYSTKGVSHEVLWQIGLARKGTPVSIVIEKADWAIRWYGEFTSQAANKIAPGISSVSNDPASLRSGIVEFGSQYQFVEWANRVPRRCSLVSTFFHGKPEDGPAVERHIEQFLKLERRLSRVICSASIVRNRLIDWGVVPEKLSLIPIGCETNRFVPPTTQQREEIRCKFAIPSDALVIGSFQKDGEGWDKGLEPKLIKGPDIFLAAVERLSRDQQVFVLLTGPARGYVMQGLENLGIPYTHHYATDRDDLARCYHALDLYLVTSREEGGPMALMESMASHVPIVSTPVGMAPDLISDGISGGLTVSVDPDEIASKAEFFLSQSDEKQMQMKQMARDSVLQADWNVVGRRQLEEVWQPLLQNS
ncbi:MAG: glycosyltransferase family 4 protein [Pseudomonadota bacterium]